MRRIAGAAAVLAAAGGTGAEATAGAAERQTYTAAFSTAAPGAPAGLRIGFDYVDPADPAGKPPAVARVVQDLAPGTRIDTTVPDRCEAPDARLVAEGPGACPPGSRVGAGVLHVDTGAGGGPAPRVVEFDVTLLNADEQLILLLESTNLPARMRIPSRSRVAGSRTYISETPPLPGADPSDPYVAIKHVRLAIDEITRGGRAYLTTPPSCTGTWLNRGTFTYRDGVVETVDVPVACSAVAPAPSASGAPRGARGTLVVVARPPASARLLNRRGGIGVALRVDGSLRDVRVRLVRRRDGRTVARTRLAALERDTRVRLRRVARARRGTHEVIVTGRAAGHAMRATRTVRLR